MLKTAVNTYINRGPHVLWLYCIAQPLEKFSYINKVTVWIRQKKEEREKTESEKCTYLSFLSRDSALN